MPRILFVRDFKPTKDGGIRTSGGQIKVRDYFMHCLQHPKLEPYLYFTPRSSYEDSELWAEVPRERIVGDDVDASYDLGFVAGKDWELLAKTAATGAVIHYLQSLEQCDEAHPLFGLLKRPAHRICVSDAVAAASAPHRTGEVTVIESGIPLGLFAPGTKRAGSALIWGRKSPAFATRLHEALRARGVECELLLEYVSREEFARRLGESELFIGIPKPSEGFFLPALEAMASGCAVVCPDASGNRGFCVDGETCLMPDAEDLDSYLDMIDRVRRDEGLRAWLQRAGAETAAAHSLDAERERFHHFVDRVILGT